MGAPQDSAPEESTGWAGARWLTSVTGAAVEATWIAAHLAIYPTGLIRRRSGAVARYDIQGLPPLQRGLLIGDVEAAGTPVLLVHGMADNRAIFALLARRLRLRGFHRVETINYPPTTNDLRAAAALLAEQVEGILAETGYEQVQIVGHSLGGLVARYYVQRLGGHARVHRLITLGTPHSGTVLAYALPVRLGRQLRPGSELYAELAQPAAECRTRFVAYWSDLDQLVVPQSHARLEHPDLLVHNVQVRGVGHMSLPIHGRLVHELTQQLSSLAPSSPPDATET